MAIVKKMAKRKQDKIEIIWRGVTNFTGYSVAAAYYVKTLRELGVKVQFKAIDPNDTSPAFKKEFPFLFKNPKVSSDAFDINHSIGNTNPKQILYQVWDGVTTPRGLVRWANNSRELWTCSEFSRHAYWVSGCSRHIEVIPHGTDPKIFKPNVKPLYNLKRFTFLTAAFSNDLKENMFNLCAVFLKEFHGEPVDLLIHTRPSQEEDLKKKIRKMLNFSRPFRQIKFTKKYPITMRQMARLYASCDAYVSTTRGESFSLNAIEAAAMDLPVVITYFGGQKEFLKDKAFWIMPECLEVFPLITYNSLFAKPLELMTRMQMREVYLNYGLAKATAKVLGKDIRKNWTWEKAAKKIIKRLKELNA